MILKSFSKINLSLKVNSKLENGLHEIQSYFCLIDLNDKIRISKIKGSQDKVSFKGSFAKLVKKKDNSVINLLNLLRRLNLISDYYSITIFKNIPVFGGLGGGTSNAATILKFLVKEELNNKLIKKAEKIVGTDLRLFFLKLGFLKNLSSVEEIKMKKKFHFVLVKPKIRCSTTEIYSKVRIYSKKEKFKKKKSITRDNFLSLLSKTQNDLQFIVEKKYPPIKKLLRDIKIKKGCFFARMTGSGSVCYGVFKDKIEAKKALNKLKTKYSNHWLTLAKTM